MTCRGVNDTSAASGAAGKLFPCSTDLPSEAAPWLPPLTSILLWKFECFPTVWSLHPAGGTDRWSAAPCLLTHIPPGPSGICTRQLQTPPWFFVGLFLAGLQMQNKASVAEIHSPSTVLPTRWCITTQPLMHTTSFYLQGQKVPCTSAMPFPSSESLPAASRLL